MNQGAELDLAALRFRDGRDRRLIQLATFADNGMSMAITLVLGGYMVWGQMSAPRPHAEYLDESIENGLKEIEAKYRDEGEGGQVPEHIAVMLKSIRENTFVEGQEQNRKDEEELWRDFTTETEKLGEDWRVRDLPPDLARRYTFLMVEPQTITLTDPFIQPAGGPPSPVQAGFIRVSINAVGAWWFGKPAISDSSD